MPNRSKVQSTTHLSPKMKPLGILGGGQLARMLALKAHELGIPVSVLSEHADDPAAQVTSLWIRGRLDDAETLRTFLSGCSVVTFESEFLDANLLSKLEAATRTSIAPRPADMAALQDRLSQKRLLTQHRLPTSEYFAVATAEEAGQAFESLGGSVGGAVVFKKRRFGYDGYGTFVVRTRKDLKAFLANFDEIPGSEHGFIAERFIPFRRELALMVARSKSGQTTRMPFVETFQKDSRCLWVKGPIKKSPALERLGRSLEKFLGNVGYVGVMGVELFDTGNGLLINELAPRVHNSGHYSMDALSEDQFALHLKCILDLPFEKPEPLSKGFAMMNLLGSSDRAPKWRLPADCKLHWYGKSLNRPGRKMGHYNVLAASPAKALALALKHRNAFKV
jgi:5-(carboxyamino)imidazole ribonucleotide synthase